MFPGNKTKQRCLITLCIVAVLAMMFYFWGTDWTTNRSIMRNINTPGHFPGRVLPVTELEVMTDAPYTDVKDCASSNNSYMLLLKTEPVYKVGDDVEVFIVLRNGYNRSIDRGGDMVRVWLKEESQGASVAGYVIDHKNGSYSGFVKAAWRGNPTVYSSLAGSRESIQFYYKTYSKYGATKHISGLFVNDVKNKTFVALCSPESSVPGFDNVCNLTHVNHGMSWFCGKKPDFSCKDYTASTNSPILSLTTLDGQVLHERMLHQKLPNSYTIQVVTGNEETVMNTSHVPCNVINPHLTWTVRCPTGFFHNRTWYPVYCQNFATNHSFQPETCLRNRRLWLFGDSTTRAWFYAIKQKYGMKMLTQEWKGRTKWHLPSLAAKSNWNFTVFWGPHESPFSSNQLATSNTKIPFHEYAETISNSSKDIFVICLYTHLIHYHPHIFINRLNKIYDAVVKLLTRAPGVVIAYKGYHAFNDHHTFSSLHDDYFGLLYQQIVTEKFKPVYNRVLYLHHWDMTVGEENDEIHPNDIVDLSMVTNLISHTCR